MADVGIDLGTTNSVLAILRGAPEVINIKGKSILPSAVMYDEGDWVVGTAAKAQQAARPDTVIVSPKRHMGTDTTYTIGGQTYTPADMSAKILKEIKKHAEAFLGEPISKAIITIPAHFNQQQIDDTQKAAGIAGLNVGKLLQEPVAASATYPSGGDERVLVFDLGGGTLDCTVVDTWDARISGISGDNWLGGDDFDWRIVDRLLQHLKDESKMDLFDDKMARLRLKAVAEQHKINLSEANATQIEFVGKLGAAGKLAQIDFRLTRKDYNALIKDLVDKALQKADEAVARAGLTKKEIDVVLLVGGSTLTPYVVERLADHFGKTPCSRVDPMLAVGLGAAVCTRDLVWDSKTHRVALGSTAVVWSKPTYNVKGRTTGGSKVEVTGGAQPASATVSADGKFDVPVALSPNAINNLTVQATAPSGETAKAMHNVRHDAAAAVVEEPAPPPVVQPPLARNILLGLEHEHVAVIVKAGTPLPTAGEIVDKFFTKANKHEHVVQGPVYEGHDPEHEIPVGVFNTLLGQLVINCPPTPEDAPVVIGYEVDESRNITMRCYFKNTPNVKGEVKIKTQALSRDRMHLIERCEVTLNSLGQRLPPDEKRDVQRKEQALKDLCEQYTTDSSEDTRARIVMAGKELLETLRALEQRFKL